MPRNDRARVHLLGQFRSRPRRVTSIGTAMAAIGASVVVSLAHVNTADAVPAPQSYGVFASSAVPRVTAEADTAKVTLGMVFTTKSSGTITAIRFYKAATNTGKHVGQLWTTGGKLLATVSFVNETRSGWQTAKLSSPVAVTTGVSYVAAYVAPRGRYSDDQGVFTSKAIVHNNLTAVRGVYTYGSGIPRQTWRGSNYYVDVAFTAGRKPVKPTPPKPTPTKPTPPKPTPPTSAPVTTAKPSPTTSTPPTTVSAPPTVSSPPTTLPGEPSASNTGVPAGTKLTASGSITITTPNQVVNAFDVSGSIVVEAPGVVIKNSKVHGTASNGIYVKSGDVTIYDSEIFGFENAIAFDNWKAYRVNIHGTSGDGVKLGDNVTLQDSWIHDLTPAAGAHSDGGQMQSGVVNLVVHHNVIDLSTTSNANSALFLAPDLGPSTNGPVTISDNWFDGGNFTVFCLDGDNGRYYVKNISLVGNHFGTHHQYGMTDINVPITESQNVYGPSNTPFTA